MKGFIELETPNDVKVSAVVMENHTKYAINMIISYGYTREEAINILNGRNPDGSEFIELPF